MRSGLSVFNIAALVLGLTFLYLPLVVLVVYSFNESDLVTFWGGWSTKWYVSLMGNQTYLSAAGTTLRIALVSSLLSAVLGTMAAFALVRHAQFRGRGFLQGATLAPLMMPEVVIGLSLLLAFVALGIGRGFGTIVIAHTTFGLCFVAITVRARLATFNISLEEAALDLGASPASAFFRVTLPGILPAVISGWLLSFILSLDNLVVTSFAAGASTTTLPMAVFGSLRKGLNPEINALSTILLGIVAVGTLVYYMISQRMARRTRA